MLHRSKKRAFFFSIWLFCEARLRLCLRAECLCTAFYYINRNRTEFSLRQPWPNWPITSLTSSCSPFLRRVCYYLCECWHTQVITSELWWLSLFGAGSRLIGPISSWVDVPGAGHNLIKQRRSATAGLRGEKKELPLSVLSWPEAEILLWDHWAYGNCVSEDLSGWQLFVCVGMCEDAFMWMLEPEMDVVILPGKSIALRIAQVQLSSAVATVTGFANSCKCFPLR